MVQLEGQDVVAGSSEVDDEEVADAESVEADLKEVDVSIRVVHLNDSMGRVLQLTRASTDR